MYGISTECLSWEKDRIRHAEIANFSNMRRKRKNHGFKGIHTDRLAVNASCCCNGSYSSASKAQSFYEILSINNFTIKLLSKILSDFSIAI